MVKNVFRCIKYFLQGYILYLEKYSLLYCRIYKVASSSWTRIFLEASNTTVPEDKWLQRASQIFRPKENVSLQDLFANSTVSFTFVRHPFERLMSVYRDKFELATETEMGQLFFKYYSAQILDLPESSIRTEEKIPMPSFSQFVTYLLDISELDYNDHWLPYWLHCKFCDNKSVEM